MASQRWLKLVWEQMHRELVTSSVIHADETVVQVLHEPGKNQRRIPGCGCTATAVRFLGDYS